VKAIAWGQAQPTWRKLMDSDSYRNPTGFPRQKLMDSDSYRKKLYISRGCPTGSPGLKLMESAKGSTSGAPVVQLRAVRQVFSG